MISDNYDKALEKYYQEMLEIANKREEYRRVVYDFLFYCDKKWDFPGQSQYFLGHSIHYSDFMKAKKGML